MKKISLILLVFFSIATFAQGMKFEENKYLQGDMNKILNQATEQYASSFCTDTFFLLPVLKAWKEHVDSYTKADVNKEKVKNYQWAKSD